MKMGIISKAMWRLFAPVFKRNLSLIGVEDKKVMMAAKEKYYGIVNDIKPFGENDILLVNLLSAAQIAAIYLVADKKPTVDQMNVFYSKTMDDSRFMHVYLKSMNYYSKGYQKSLAKQAERSWHSDNPYSWRFKFYPGKSLNSFDAIFDRCGICYLFNKLKIKEIVPALCAYDYGMAKWTKTEFSRNTTIASGGDVCDCHYLRKEDE